VKSVIKALSRSRFGSSPETPPKSLSPDHTGGEDDEKGAAASRYGGISSPPPEIHRGDVHREGESDAFKPEIRSKSPKIRSLLGNETEKRNVEASFPPESGYSERRSTCFSETRALRDDPSPLPDFS
jgi:hypothetical protein